jgi:hypothetical protein
LKGSRTITYFAGLQQRFARYGGSQTPTRLWGQAAKRLSSLFSASVPDQKSQIKNQKFATLASSIGQLTF